jgi:hypothetical protein
MDKELILGTDYETIDSIIKKTSLKTRQAINYRIQVLKKRGVVIESLYNNRGVYWLRKDADKIMNIKFTKNRSNNVTKSKNVKRV